MNKLYYIMVLYYKLFILLVINNNMILYFFTGSIDNIMKYSSILNLKKNVFAVIIL